MDRPMNEHDMRDVMRGLDPRHRYGPTTREYGQIMLDGRQKRADALRAARERAAARRGKSAS